MKKLLFIIPFLFLTNCKGDDTINNCNFLIDVGVSASVNLNLPEYSQLMFSLNSVYIANQGNAGIYVINVGNGNYRAWDAADPNHVQTNCSFLQRDDIIVTCTCPDQNEYDLLTGQKRGDPLPCGLKEYRVTVSGSNISITN